MALAELGHEDEVHVSAKTKTPISLIENSVQAKLMLQN
jgi:hypothetical protein